MFFHGNNNAISITIDVATYDYVKPLVIVKLDYLGYGGELKRTHFSCDGKKLLASALNDMFAKTYKYIANDLEVDLYPREVQKLVKTFDSFKSFSAKQ